MIVFDNWVIRPEKETLLRQFDHGVTTLKVTGNLPQGWEWVMLVKSGKNMDLLPLEIMEDGIGIILTAQQLALSGSYLLQLRGKKGELVRHTNTVTVYIEASLSGDVQWPVVPSEFSDLERRVSEKVVQAEGYTAHPPVIGENGNWFVWNDTQYTDSGWPSLGRSIANGQFNERNGRWEIVYTDGTTVSFAGHDPANTFVWSVIRDGFERYNTGAFAEQCGPDWRMSGSYVNNVCHDIVEDGGSKYLMLTCMTKDAQAVTILNHQIQGEHVLEFDYMPTLQGAVTPSKTATDFFEVRLFTTSYYAPDADPDGPDLREHIRARVNLKGRHCIYTTGVWGTKQSEYIRNSSGAHYLCEPGVWYRVKVYVRVGQIVMKIWCRDSESEPAGISGPGVVALAHDYLTAEYLAVPHDLRLYYGKMQEEPPTADGWRMGLDNVRVYRDMRGMYVGSGEMPPNCYLQIDPDGDTLTEEELVNAVLASIPDAEGVAY